MLKSSSFLIIELFYKEKQDDSISESSYLFLFYILGFFLNILYKETITVTNPKSMGNHGMPNKEYFNSSKED